MTELEFAQAALDKARERYLAANAKRTGLQQGGVSSRDHESHELLQLRNEVTHWEKRVKALSGKGRAITHTRATFASRRCSH